MDMPAPAEWFHVVHRGVGRRPVFARTADVRAFLELVGRHAGRGAFELHAYAVLTNHCHLLLRARPSTLWDGLRGVFGPFARRINQRLRRDGPLFGSRPRRRRIRSGAHWRATVAYIDRNPVDAGLAARAAQYPFGSAWHYARMSGPPWLQRGVIEEFVRREAGASVYRPSDYARVFGDTVLPGGSQIVVARRLSRPERANDPLDGLLAAAPADVRRWLERLALSADGAAAGPSLIDPSTLLAELHKAKLTCSAWTLDPGPTDEPAGGFRRKRRGGLRRDGWSVMACGLLRTACGLTLDEIGQLVELSVSGVHYQARCHSRLILVDGTYKSRAASLVAAALRKDFPEERSA